MKLSEQLVVIIIIGILSSIGLSSFLGFLNRSRLDSAIFQIQQSMRFSQIEAIDAAEPKTLCIKEENNTVKIANISGGDCEQAANWRSLSGVQLDKANSTLRTQKGVAGNGGSIYRASWADTAAGLGGSYGQLGRITITAGERRKCVFLKNIQGEIEVREATKCVRK